ncbi:MAG: HNH endonuclease, partial [Nocardioidaceae bacterium]
MFDFDLSALDETAILSHVEEVRVVAEQTEVRLLRAAACWADLHSELARATSPLLPGSEKLVCFGGDGTPALAEFAPAELGVVLATSSSVAERLVGDALD